MTSRRRDDLDGDGPALAGRGVHEEPYLRRGCRVFVSVDHRGEFVSERLVAVGRDPRAAIADLWQELDDLDAIGIRGSPPCLRVVT